MTGNPDNPQSRGIIPNTFAHIFGHISKCQGNQKFLVRVSYMEIYNEEVRDLLGKELNKSLEVKERTDIGVFVKDLSGFVVNNAADLENIMKLGNRNRAVGATKMNTESSRSHAIFSITVESIETDEHGEEHVKMGKLQLVDLAVRELFIRPTWSSWSRNRCSQSLLGLGTTKQNAGDGRPTEGSHKNQPESIYSGQRNQRPGRRQVHTHSVPKLKADASAARFPRGQLEDRDVCEYQSRGYELHGDDFHSALCGKSQEHPELRHY